MFNGEFEEETFSALALFGVEGGGKRRMISRVIDIWSAFGFYF